MSECNECHKDLFHQFSIVINFFQVLIADEVTLSSGDRLIGTVQEMNNEYIIIDTAFSKGLKIEHSMIVTLSTTQPVTVVFNNGQSQ